MYLEGVILLNTNTGASAGTETNVVLDQCGIDEGWPHECAPVQYLSYSNIFPSLFYSLYNNNNNHKRRYVLAINITDGGIPVIILAGTTNDDLTIGSGKDVGSEVTWVGWVHWTSSSVDSVGVWVSHNEGLNFIYLVKSTIFDKKRK